MVGAEVFGIVDWWHDGAAADLVLVRPDHIVQKPEGLTHAQAASLPTAGMVALRTLDMLGASSHRRRLVVDGHPDPVVVLAIQLARRPAPTRTSITARLAR